jgi:hypothetical protein
MVNSAMVGGTGERTVKPAGDNGNSDEPLVEKVKKEKQLQEIPELIPDQPQMGQLNEQVLLLEIQRQLAERDPCLRAKDIQLQEMEERLRMYTQSGSYRLGRTLTWPLRSIKKLLYDRR